MNNASAWGDKVAELLTKTAIDLPDGFFCSFDYTLTGQNLTHPIAWGAIVRGLAANDGERVGIDVRLNNGAGAKFQPDIVLFDRSFNPIVCIDYESPNSSDSRIPLKDIQAFISWQAATLSSSAYVIVTTLPDAARPAWEIRYTAGGQYNEGMRPHTLAIRENPFRFWKIRYDAEFARLERHDIAWVNLDQRYAERVYPDAKR